MVDPALTRLHTRRRQTLASRRNEGYTLADDFRIPGAHPGELVQRRGRELLTRQRPRSSATCRPGTADAAVFFEAIAEASHDEMPVLLAEYVCGADENVDS